VRRARRAYAFLSALGLAVTLSSPAELAAQSLDLDGLGRIQHSLKTLDVPVEISADEMQYSRSEDVLTARGHLRLTQGALSLEADEAQLHREAGRLVAVGGITAHNGDDALEAEGLEFDLKTRAGTLSQGRLFLTRDHYHVTGERIEWSADQRYRLERATITTCDWDEARGERPAWRLRARRMIIEPEQYLTARDVVLTIKDVPILYLPYMIWPVKTERQTGLLPPQLGYSTSEGPKIRQPLFIALGPSHDATLTLDERARRGIGGTLEYRYRLSRRSHGQVEVEAFYDRLTDSLRRRASTSQLIDFNDRLQLRVSGEYVSDDGVLRDLRSPTFDRTRRTIESNLFLAYHDPYQTMTFLTRYTRDLAATADDAVQLLPSLEYRLVSARAWGTPLFLSVQGSATNFWRRTGFSTQRADLFPVLMWRQEAPFGLIVTPRVGLRETFYTHDGLGGDPVRRELSVAGLGVAGAARREWSRANGDRLIHAVEPGILYTYVGERRRENLPQFDEIDDVPEQSLITATLTNRLLVRASTGPDATPVTAPDLERLWVRLTQSYRLARRVDPVSGALPSTWSATRGEATLRTNRVFSLDADAFYDHARHTFTTVDTDARVAWDPHGDVSIGHRSTRDATPQRPLTTRGDVLDPLSLGGVTTDTRPEIDYYIVTTRVHLTKGLTLANKTYYNRQTRAYTEIDYGVQYQGQCWAVTFTYQDFPEKNEFGVVLTLVGAGSVDSRAASDLFATPSR